MECFWALGQRLDFLATGETTGCHYSLFHLFVLVEETWRRLGPGELVHVPRGTVHTFRNTTTQAARALSGFVPSGFERFFRDFGHPARVDDLEPLPVEEVEIQRVIATASRYDMEFGSP